MSGILVQATFVAATYAFLYALESTWIQRKPVAVRQLVKATVVAYTAAAGGLWAAGSLKAAGIKKGGSPGAFVGKPGF